MNKILVGFTSSLLQLDLDYMSPGFMDQNILWNQDLAVKTIVATSLALIPTSILQTNLDEALNVDYWDVISEIKTGVGSSNIIDMESPSSEAIVSERAIVQLITDQMSVANEIFELKDTLIRRTDEGFFDYQIEESKNMLSPLAEGNIMLFREGLEEDSLLATQTNSPGKWVNYKIQEDSHIIFDVDENPDAFFLEGYLNWLELRRTPTGQYWSWGYSGINDQGEVEVWVENEWVSDVYNPYLGAWVSVELMPVPAPTGITKSYGITYEDLTASERSQVGHDSVENRGLYQSTLSSGDEGFGQSVYLSSTDYYSLFSSGTPLFHSDGNDFPGLIVENANDDPIDAEVDGVSYGSLDYRQFVFPNPGVHLNLRDLSIRDHAIAEDADISDTKLATIVSTDKVEGTAIQIHDYSAIENVVLQDGDPGYDEFEITSKGLRINPAFAGQGLEMSEDVVQSMSITSDLSFVTSVGTISSGSWQADPISSDFIEDINQQLLTTSTVFFTGLQHH